jgi:hypothetical protein
MGVLVQEDFEADRSPPDERGTMKAIETVYNDYRFRSRLEARWAVFFDALGVRYEYEPQGFVVEPKWMNGPAWHYLPDFYLPDLGTWVEVKGSLDGLDTDYFNMLAWAIDYGGALPGMRDSYGSTRGLLWLGPIPTPDRVGWAPHVIFQHEKGGLCGQCGFTPEGGLYVPGIADLWFDALCCPGDEVRDHLRQRVYAANPLLECDTGGVGDAYRAARQARFEHGETPVVASR